jgi:hypothetical protein
MSPVTRLALRCTVVLAIASAAALVFPAFAGAVAGVAALVVFVLFGAHVTVGLTSGRGPRRRVFEAALAPVQHSVRRPPDLERLERLLGWRNYSGRDFDQRLRPLLQRLITYKLRARHGVDAARDPAAARALLPENLEWVLDEPKAYDSRGDAVFSTAAISSMIDAIERL